MEKVLKEKLIRMLEKAPVPGPAERMQVAAMLAKLRSA